MTNIMNNYQIELIAAAALLLLGVLLILVLRIYASAKLQNEQIKLIDLLIHDVNPSGEFQKNLCAILRILSGVISAKGYAYYFFDSKENKYIVRAIRYADEDVDIGPAYSGLVPFKTKEYIPTYSISPKPVPQKYEFVKDKDITLLVIPMVKGSTLLTIGPLTALTPFQKKILDAIVDKLERITGALIEVDQIKSRVGNITKSEKAISSIANMVNNEDAMQQAILNISQSLVGANSGFFLKKDGSGITVAGISGFAEGVKSRLGGDQEACQLFFDMVGKQEMVQVDQTQKEFYDLPPFVAANQEMLLIVKLNSADIVGVIVFGFLKANGSPQLDEFHQAGLRLMVLRLVDVLNYQTKMKEVSDSYINILKGLAQTLDHMSPYKIGNCELMYRYSKIIAKEMGVSDGDAEEIALAGYLSNIGVVALSNDLLLKEGRYREDEYEMMKLHAEVGAAIIEAMVADRKLASYIRSHHERIDGHGYPAGLRGDEIPLGARIIAVTQTFVAKISGRKNRPPLEFKKALQLLESSAGTQLDAAAVEALTGWFEKEEERLGQSNKALGNCWEIRCSPATICQKCPAYQKEDVNCWELKGQCCEEHGNRCDTCFIFTEYCYRTNTEIEPQFEKKSLF